MGRIWWVLEIMSQTGFFTLRDKPRHSVDHCTLFFKLPRQSGKDYMLVKNLEVSLGK